MKTGIFVDNANILAAGGRNIRYRNLLNYLDSVGDTVIRANIYATCRDIPYQSESVEQAEERLRKTEEFHDILRKDGYKVLIKKTKVYWNELGEEEASANSDMDLAMDALLQSDNLDKIIIVSGDGDFARLVEALQIRGPRVEVIGLKHVSQDLRKAVDCYIDGFTLPGLVPIVLEPAQRGSQQQWHRGKVYQYNEERGFGFLSYYVTGRREVQEIYFHATNKANYRPTDRQHVAEELRKSDCYLEFTIEQNDKGEIASNWRFFVPNA